jgi:hypothetical protein
MPDSDKDRPFFNNFLKMMVEIFNLMKTLKKIEEHKLDRIIKQSKKTPFE